MPRAAKILYITFTMHDNTLAGTARTHFKVIRCVWCAPSASHIELRRGRGQAAVVQAAVATAAVATAVAAKAAVATVVATAAVATAVVATAVVAKAAVAVAVAPSSVSNLRGEITKSTQSMRERCLVMGRFERRSAHQ